MLRLGISACFNHADPLRPIFKGKTLLYLVEPLSHWLMSQGHLAYMIPPVPPNGAVRVKDLVGDLDGLILQGGADVAPQSYGETPLKPEWSGDFVRDQYEISLVKEFCLQKKPILGVCRGLQLLNVALGGSLYQDINTQVPDSLSHRNWEIYDQNFHEIILEPNSYLSKLYSGIPKATVNSVHHQSIKTLAPGFSPQAFCPADNVLEAIRWEEDDQYIMAIQWHPEFQTEKDRHLLPTEPLLKDFLNYAQNN